MKLTLNNEDIWRRTEYRPGQRCYFAFERVYVTIIGEDDTHVWSITDSGHYVGIHKDAKQLAALKVANDIGISVSSVKGSDIQGNVFKPTDGRC